MNRLNRFSILGVAFIAVTVIAIWAVTGRSGSQPASSTDAKNEHSSSPTMTASLINNGEIFLNANPISNGGSTLAYRFMEEVRDSSSLEELRNAIRRRAIRGIEALRENLARLERSSAEQTLEMARLHYQIGLLLSYEGRFSEAVSEIELSQRIGASAGSSAAALAELNAVLGIIALRRGEVDNCIGCVGPSSCILPISPAAVHRKPAGSREAIRQFQEYLAMAPGDLRVRWVLNLAYMTLNEYPDRVPPEYLVPIGGFDSTADVGRFDNVAAEVGLLSRGPNQAGGSVFDDFTGDGLPDLFVTSLDADRGASLFVNLGDGRFEDRSDEAGLADQVYALNLVRADYDNDGHPDVVLLRGAWEGPMRMSLLRNLGNCTFEDVTIASGLGEPISSQTAAWGDYDDDGLLDLFVGGEYLRPFASSGKSQPFPGNRCRLYHNLGNGKFKDVAAELGVAEEQCTKGSAWGDYDGDGRLDLLVSNMNAPCRLYHHEKDGRFRDVAGVLGVTGPARSFACWFWDYDNDGRLDIYVNDYSGSLAEFVAVSLKLPLRQRSRPRLYRNVGSSGFHDVTNDVGLDRDILPMGCNFGDIDNDGFLDLYFGTGSLALEVLVPNIMLKSDKGRNFLDVTTSSGTGHLQKGHGVSFADWNCDGNIDLFVAAGGAVPGDRSHNLLFQNLDHGNHWLKIKLVGSRTNRSAFGARIEAVVAETDGTRRSIHRTIGNNSSFGGNTLVESIGLRDAKHVTELKVYWPTTKTTQTFHDVPGDQAIEITEGIDAIRPIHQTKVSIQ